MLPRMACRCSRASSMTHLGAVVLISAEGSVAIFLDRSLWKAAMRESVRVILVPFVGSTMHIVDQAGPAALRTIVTSLKSALHVMVTEHKSSGTGGEVATLFIFTRLVTF